jgi:DNA polymerase I-like protein with 3'-5' exonuclease and polymerase domains
MSMWRVPHELPDLRRVGIIGLDTETRDISLAADHGSGWATRNGHLCGVSIAYRTEGEVHGLYFPLRHPDTENFDPDNVYRWLNDHVAADALRFVTQNGLYDWGWLRVEGNVRMPPSERIEEIGALATIVDENRYRYSLESLCQWRDLPGKDESLLREGCEALGLMPTSKRKKFRPQEHLWQLPARYVGPYAEADAANTLRLFEDLNPILGQENTQAAYRLECDLLPMVLEMRLRGVRIDVTAAERARDLLLGKRDAILTELSDKLGMPVSMYELARSKWLAETFDREGIKYPRTEKGNPSFTGGQSGWMDKHAHPLPRLLKQAEKYHNAGANFVGKYILDYAVNGRIHAEIHPHRSEANGTRSFRFSYSDPPLQLMSSRDEELTPLIRGLFLPEEGEMWAKPDASQQEFRFAVHYAVCHKVPKAEIAAQRFQDDPSTDFHALTASITELDRTSAKAVNFAKIYGAGVRKFAAMIGKPQAEAQQIYAQYDRELPFLRALSRIYQSIARRQGYITLYDGARRHFNDWAPGGKWAKGAGPCEREEALRRINDPEHPWYQRGPLYRADVHTALNALIQGSAARHTKLWMRACWREGIVPLLQMHDCLDCSVATPEQAELVGRLCVEAVKLRVPMKVDLKYGRNWGDAKHTWDGLSGEKETPTAIVAESEPRLIITPSSIEAPMAAVAAESPLPPPSPPSSPPPPPPPPPPSRVSAMAQNEDYQRGENGEITADFDFTADLIGTPTASASNGSGAGTASTGAKTNGGTAANASAQARTVFVYRTATGDLHMKVVRTPDKRYPTFRWTGQVWAKGWPTKIVPYRLVELLKAPPEEPVLIPEGEKDSDNLAALGFITTTNPGGAGKWTPECAQYLQGKQIAVLLQDNDIAGAKHVAKVRATLNGIVPTIITLSFENEVEEHGDVSDWLEFGGTAAALRTRIQLALKRNTGAELTVVQLSQDKPEAIDWLWDGHLIRGDLEIMSGRPGVGKSQVQCQIFACITTGCDWPDGTPGPKSGHVILLSAEDSRKEYIRRCTAAGADLDRIHMITAVRRDQKANQAFLLAEDLDKLERCLDRLGDVTLIGIDPITAFIGTGNKVDSNRASDVRAILTPLMQLAERTNIAVSMVTHPVKNAGTELSAHFIASQAFFALPRSSHICLDEVVKNEIDGSIQRTGHRLFGNAKTNNRSEDVLMLRYDLEEVDLGLDLRLGTRIKTTRVRWFGLADVTTQQALANSKPVSKQERAETARHFLAALLANGPMLQAKVLEEGAKHGFSADQLQRAKRGIGARSIRAEAGKLDSPWLWALA